MKNQLNVKLGAITIAQIRELAAQRGANWGAMQVMHGYAHTRRGL